MQPCAFYVENYFIRGIIFKYGGENLKNFFESLEGEGLVFEAFLVELGKSISAALTYLHGEGIMHRDVKPDK